MPLDEAYFRWLYSLVADPDAVDPSRTYWRLLKKLFRTEFVWVVPNDDNRLQDGKDLRHEFLQNEGIVDIDHHWLELGCSTLELMVGLARRLSFQADGQPHYWFWKMIENIGLDGRPDNWSFTKRQLAEIDDILDRVIWRTYDRNGRGGFFPLRNPDKDQRKVELWYQMGAYVLELS